MFLWFNRRRRKKGTKKKYNKILEQKHEINYFNALLMVDNFLPAFDMKKEKEIKKDENIDAQISKIREDINNRKKNDKYFN